MGYQDLLNNAYQAAINSDNPNDYFNILTIGGMPQNLIDAGKTFWSSTEHTDNTTGLVDLNAFMMALSPLYAAYEVTGVGGAVEEAVKWSEWLRENWLWVLIAIIVGIIIIIGAVHFLIIAPKIEMFIYALANM